MEEKRKIAAVPSEPVDEVIANPHHPHRIQMTAVWKAERAIREKRFELKKMSARLSQEIAELENNLDKAVFNLALECGMSPGVSLDTDKMKWKLKRDTSDEKSPFENVDIDSWKNGDYDK